MASSSKRVFSSNGTVKGSIRKEVDRLRGQLHRICSQTGRALRDPERQLGDPRDFLRGQHRARGEAPRASIEHPHSEAAVTAVVHGGNPPVLPGHRVRLTLLDADIAILGL